jgi:urease accessory protein
VVVKTVFVDRGQVDHLIMNQPLAPSTLLRLLQLVDSGFPTGAFSFSNGLEGIAAFGLLAGEADVRTLIETQISEGLAGIELPAVFEAHLAARERDLDRFKQLDHLLTALKPIPAFRAASVKVGRRYLESASPLIESPFISRYHELVRAGQTEGHHATVFGIVFESAGIDANTTVLAFAAAFLQGQAAAAVRLGLIGQSAALRLVSGLHPALVSAVATAHERPVEQWGAYQPMLDLAGLRQPQLTGRLFAS